MPNPFMEKFGSKAVRRGGTFWFAPVDAIAVIEVAKAQKVLVQGLDGAFLGPTSTQPSLEDSWDYTIGSYPYVSDRYAHAIEFIKIRENKGLHFDVTVRNVIP